MVPFGWRAREGMTARLIASLGRSTGQDVSAEDCYNDYLAPITEDDEDLLDEAADFVLNNKDK